MKLGEITVFYAKIKRYIYQNFFEVIKVTDKQ